MKKLNIIEELVQFLGKNMSQIGREIGKRDVTVLYNIQTGRNKMSRNLAAKLKETYPQLNELYLLTGEGSIGLDLKEDTLKENPVNKSLEKQIKLLERLSDGQDARIKLLEDRVATLEQRLEPEKNLTPQSL